MLRRILVFLFILNYIPFGHDIFILGVYRDLENIIKLKKSIGATEVGTPNIPLF